MSTTTAAPPPAPPQRSLLYSFGPLLAGCALAGVLLTSLAAGPQRDAGDLALGENTRSVFAEIDGDRIHCLDLYADNAGPHIDECLDAAIARESAAYGVWLGNSQVHGVNRREAGDSTAAQVLHRALGRGGVDLVTLSQPNANLQEHYVVYEYARDRLPGLDLLVLPVVFDDTREDGVRGRLSSAFDRPGVRAALGQTEAGREIAERYGPVPTATQATDDGATPSATDADLAALDETVQEAVEVWINDRLDEASDLWRKRPGFRARLFGFLYLARNTVLQIDPSTVRPMVPGPYAANLAALEATLVSARESGVEVLVYVAPIRNDTDIPYRLDEYARFKADVAALAETHGAEYVDLEGIVPGPMWGMKASTNLSGRPEYDFMHFTADGHRLLADALRDEITGRILTAPPRRAR